jgi:hypothetical protein
VDAPRESMRLVQKITRCRDARRGNERRSWACRPRVAGSNRRCARSIERAQSSMFSGQGRSLGRVPRLADHGPVVYVSHHVQKWRHHGGIERQRRRQLHEYRPAFLRQAVGLIDKRDKRCSRVLQLQFMRNRPRDLDGESEIRRRAVAPLRVSRCGVRPVKRRVDLGATE